LDGLKLLERVVQERVDIGESRCHFFYEEMCKCIRLRI
jgi:hypothetical protein